jgi:hypothetical protein
VKVLFYPEGCSAQEQLQATSRVNRVLFLFGKNNRKTRKEE